MSLHGINLDSKLGAAFLGNIIASMFYGITCVQTYIYFKKDHKDSKAFKGLISSLWALDTLHLAFVTHGLYYYLVSNFGNLLAIVSPTWSILGQVYITCISDFIIRCIFGRRVWLMTGRNLYIAGGIATTSLLTLITGFIFTTRAFAVVTFENFSLISYLLYTSLASGVAADVIIAGSLCHSLSRSRTGFRNTDSLVNLLILYTINTSLLTTICSAACFITYTIWPHEFTFIGIYFSLNKLFLNSLLATLNGRESLSEKIRGLSEIVSSDVSSRRLEFSTKDSSRYNSRPGHSSVVVTINRQVDVDNSDGSMGYPPRRLSTIPLSLSNARLDEEQK